MAREGEEGLLDDYIHDLDMMEFGRFSSCYTRIHQKDSVDGGPGLKICADADIDVGK